MAAGTPFLFAALVVLLLISGFCSCSETAFFSLTPLRLRRLTQGHPRSGERIHDLLSRPTRLLSAILILNTIVNVSAATVAFALASRFLDPRYAEVVSIAVFTLLLLLFGEYGPKHLGLMHAERLTRLFEPVLRGVTIVLSPLQWGLERVTRVFRLVVRPARPAMSSEEFATAVDIGGQEGVIDEEELSMIKAIVGMDNKKVSDVMHPRMELIGLDLEGDAGQYLDHVRRARRRHLLLYRGMLENVEGFLDCRKFLLDPEHRVDAARLPPYFIPENLPLGRLLLQFQRTKNRIAVVVDEYGSVSGVVTRGDVLEEISGEIYQELSRPRPVFMESGPRRWIVDAALDLNAINRRLNLELEAEDSERLAGWVSYHAGHVPAEGETVEAQGVRTTVLKADRGRVTLLQIQLPEAPSA